MNTKTAAKRISRVLGNISQPARIRILLSIGESEACVCHLEAMLGYRQAYISQQLMELRKAKLVDARRDGRFIFYRLSNRQLLDLIQMAGELSGVSPEELATLTAKNLLHPCCCPDCVAKLKPTQQDIPCVS
ncbi:MAG: helix-turn-helix transcriptional regulator [Anaerolineales bacterium]|nr:helix-turn-helix transcriptional regulator [Anaerolineales bacterium]